MTTASGSHAAKPMITKGRHVTGRERAELTALLIELYRDGASIRQLADQTGRSYQTIRAMLTDAGLTMRPRGGYRPPPGPAPDEPEHFDVIYAQALGRELRRLRRAKGWTRARMCRDLPISVQTLATYENGTRALAATRLAELCIVLDTQPHIVLATVDRAAMPMPDAVTIDLVALVHTARADIAPAQRWAEARLRALAPGHPSPTTLDTAALDRLADVCGMTTPALVAALSTL